EVIANTVPHETTRSESLSDRSHRRDSVVFLSNLIQGKGHEDFLEIGIRLLDDGVSAQFVLAGASPDEQTSRAIAERIQRSGHNSAIEVLGSVSGSEKQRLFDSARVLVFPSQYRF